VTGFTIAVDDKITNLPQKYNTYLYC